MLRSSCRLLIEMMNMFRYMKTMVSGVCSFILSMHRVAIFHGSVSLFKRTSVRLQAKRILSLIPPLTSIVRYES